MLLLLLLLFCHEDSGRQEHINKIGFSLESSASEVLAGLGVTCSDFLAENTSRAVALNTDCSRRRSVPCHTAVQCLH